MAIWTPFYVVCSECGHKNRPDRSPSVGIKMALEGPIECKKCGRLMDVSEELRRSERPLVKAVLASLQKQKEMVPA